jgi:putative serine/threonine protein kinase
MDGEMCWRKHFLENISDEYLSRIICFPKDNCEEYSYRINILRKNGFRYFIEYGKAFSGIKFLGKGYASIVVLAYNEYYGLGALKLRRIDSRRITLEHEGMMLDYLDKTLYVPQLYMWARDFIFMEWLDPGKCMDLGRYFEELIFKNKFNELKRIIKRIILALYLIDKLGIDHGELNRPYNHIYICCDRYVKIIDWESSSYRKPHNVTMFLSFLFNRYKYRSILKDIISISDKEIYGVLRRYKKNYSIKTLLPILRSLEQP